MQWADPHRKMKVRANADIPRDAIQARAFGAEGIGLCRTEHMFFGEKKIPHMRAMILADNEKDRRAALKKLLPMQREDFAGVFKAMDGLPAMIRTDRKSTRLNSIHLVISYAVLCLKKNRGIRTIQTAGHCVRRHALHGTQPHGR